ncbi:uncharacterized protein BDV14DRAFT_205843 [Aspergillus stella-maris]|uniref:uncharacterized protein n=1 Tax=Aspergillus stella-maris TaxID=1810926 RepID=UPI003CCCE43D
MSFEIIEHDTNFLVVRLTVMPNPDVAQAIIDYDSTKTPIVIATFAFIETLWNGGFGKNQFGFVVLNNLAYDGAVSSTHQDEDGAVHTLSFSVFEFCIVVIFGVVTGSSRLSRLQ